MQIEHKKNTAYYLSFPMVDSSTPASFKTGVSPVDTAYSKDGAGAWTTLAITDTATQIASTGVYEIDLTAAEMNHDQVMIKFAVSGAADTAFLFDMRTELAEDLGDGSGVVSANVTSWLGTAVTAESGGYPSVNVHRWRGETVPVTTITGTPLVDLTHVNGAATTATLDTIKAETVLIVADTGELQTDWADAGRLDAILDSRMAEASINTTAGVVDNVNSLDTAVNANITALSIDQIWDENVVAAHNTADTAGKIMSDMITDTGTTIPALIATAQADLDIITGASGVNLLTATQASIDAIETDTTTDIPALIATAQADLDIITGASGVNLLTATQASIDAIETDTTTDIPATIATAQADLDTITGADGVFLAVTQTAGWPANLAASAGQVIKATVDTVTNTHTPTTTEFQADDITEATADHFNGRIVIFTSGALAGQATDITDYVAVGGIGQFTVTAMTEAPANNDTFVIV